MRIRAIQFSPVLGNLDKNLDFHVKKIEKAIEDNVDLIVFPELSISGYHLKDIVYEISLKPDSKIFEDLKSLSKKINIIIGAPYEETKGIIYNSAIVFSKGEIIHIHNKVQLPNFGMFEEAMIFKSDDKFIPFELGGLKIGILICREILFPHFAYLYFIQKTDFIIGISNSPHRGINKDGFSSLKLWEKSGWVYSNLYHQNFLYVNRVGFEDGIGWPGGSFFIPSGSGIEKQAKFFEEDEIDIELDINKTRRSRIISNNSRDEKPEIMLNELKRILNA